MMKDMMAKILKFIIQNKALFIILLSVLVLDRISKMLIQANMGLYDSVRVLGNFFRLSFIKNSGIAFGLFHRMGSGLPLIRIVMLVFSFAATGFVMFIYIFSGRSLRDQAATGLILGGAAGNMFDRIVLGSVTDFLDFGLGGYRWFTFNIADMAVVSGVLLLMLMMILEERKNNISEPENKEE